jgi:AbrB family looped-hinge helix DNA binding protein
VKYTVRLSSNGRITIPAECSKQLGFKSGETLILETDGGCLKIMNLRHAVYEVQQAVKRVKTSKESLVIRPESFSESGNAADTEILDSVTPGTRKNLFDGVLVLCQISFSECYN